MGSAGALCRGWLGGRAAAIRRFFGASLVVFVCALIFGPPRAARASVESRALVAARSNAESKAPWVRHTIRRGENLSVVAKRYGVRVEEILRWNDMASAAKIWPGRVVRVRSRSGAQAPVRKTYKVRKGDGWGRIARKMGVDQADLRRWNRGKRKNKQLVAGRKLVVWLESTPDLEGREPAAAEAEANDDASAPASGPAEAEPDPYAHEPEGWIPVPEGGQSVGAPNRGYLVSAVALPPNPKYYSIRNPDEVWGSTHAIELLQRALLRFRESSKYRRELVVQAISPRAGGHFIPHRSHQAGRDVDIRLPRSRRARKGSMPNKLGQVDWRATWALIVALAEGGHIEYIFLDHSRQKVLHKVALKMGVKRKQIRRILQYPRRKGSIKGLVRHAEGHSAHLHVRFRCGTDEPACEMR